MKKEGLIGERRICRYYGYVFIRVGPDHPLRKKNTAWVREHHINWFNATGERVPRGWVLHHVNEDREDNRVENLQLMTRAAHQRIHHMGVKETAEVCARMSVRAKGRCTPEWKEAVSERVKRQHAEGKFGRKTWSAEAEETVRMKLSILQTGHPSTRTKPITEESRERYRKAAIKREALKRLM